MSSYAAIVKPARETMCTPRILKGTKACCYRHQESELFSLLTSNLSAPPRPPTAYTHIFIVCMGLLIKCWGTQMNHLFTSQGVGSFNLALQLTKTTAYG